jgi:pimeloyl-ACP methyl ester carboxylesterase
MVLKKVAFASAMALLMAAATGSASEAKAVGANQQVKNIVLVHGAWADGSSWSGVIERLQKAGCHVTAVQLPLTSLNDDIAVTRNVLEAQDGPTLLVGHSYGGAVLSALGKDAPNVAGLVFESAFAPDEGESLKGLTSQGPPPPGSQAFRPDKNGLIWLDPDGYAKYFASDVSPVKARVMAATQKPIAANAFQSDQAMGAPSWRAFPTWYIMTEKDQMIPPAAQQLFAKRMGAQVTTLSASHVAMVSQPEAVANVILKAARSVGAGKVQARGSQNSPRPETSPVPRH